MGTTASGESAERSGRKTRYGRPSRDAFSTVTLTFRSDGVKCVGRLYRPDRPADPALVVLSGGPLGVGAATLEPYAERLAAAGYAVFLFDGRHLGESEGEPRNLLSPTRGRADWEAALAGLRARRDVATDRVVLWGVGLAGGIALDVAADDSRVRGVVAQTPIRSGRAFLRSRGLGTFTRGLLAGVRDVAQSPLFGTHTVPVVDEGEGGPALVSAPAAAHRYRDLAGGDWENRTPARSFLALARHTGGDRDTRLTCPVLVVGGTRDDVVPVESVETVADSIPNATLVRLPVDHFDPYDGAGVARTVGHGLAFLDSAVDK